MREAVTAEIHGNPSLRDRLVMTMLHELSHVAAFSHYTMNSFRDSAGEPRVERGYQNAPQFDIMLSDGLMETPAVAAAARAHFGCDNLTGALLQATGEQSRFSHWDRGPMYGEFMEPFSQSFVQPVVSNLSLALFHDSGWYSVDFSRAEPMDWGFQWGCHFATDACKEKGQDMASSVFCDANGLAWPNVETPGRTGRQCTYDRAAVGGCSNGDCPIVVPVFPCGDTAGSDDDASEFFGE